MPKPLFEIERYASYDKDIPVQGPGDLRLLVDFDDVDQDEVKPAMEKMVAILNKHWND